MNQRHPTILRREDALLLVVDFQQRLADVMPRRESVTAEILKIIQGVKRLGVPVLVTEQYPQGLGPTVPEIAQTVEPDGVVTKLTFSCCGDETFWEALRQTQRKQIVVVGMETHVCVLQTVLDLLANDYQVHLPADATCSRSDSNRDNALARMRQAGAILTNTESLLFELLVQAKTEEFKAILKLII